MGKKNLDKLPNGHYSDIEMKTTYLVQVQGTEVWVRILKCDILQLRTAGHTLIFDKRGETTYITIES